MLENDYDWKMLNMIKGKQNRGAVKLVTDKEQWNNKKLEAKLGLMSNTSKDKARSKIW